MNTDAQYESSPRYKIEERVGCVAVIDTDKFCGPGLHRDSIGVVRYWQGRHVPRWRKALGLVPDHQIWEVDRRDVKAAKRLEERLNRGLLGAKLVC